MEGRLNLRRHQPDSNAHAHPNPHADTNPHAYANPHPNPDPDPNTKLQDHRCVLGGLNLARWLLQIDRGQEHRLDRHQHVEAAVPTSGNRRH